VGLVDTARGFLGEVDGRIADDLARDDVLQYEMHMRALQLTQRRSVEESSDGRTPGPATSIFKTVGTDLEKRYAELMTSLRGTQGYGWEGDSFSDEELAATRRFLQSRAASIYSGSNEIQRNIIAKRVLGLPD
jgi:alkylation response protein AidB-like acyl-CoA dehydrogenase